MANVELKSKDISLGSGSLYLYPYVAAATEVIPTDADIETEANRIGHIKGGATVTWTPTTYKAVDDLERVSKLIITAQDIVFKSGIITWDANRLAELCDTGVEEDPESSGTPTGEHIFRIKGSTAFVEKKYWLRFVHQDGKHRITMLATPQGALELAFQKEQETSINAEFAALPMQSGDLLIYSDTSAVTP